MAHFAKLGLDNIVEQVVVIDNINNMTPQGIEDESVGIAFLTKILGHSTWKQTSYNGKFRKNFASIGDVYDSQKDAFIAPKPFNSWILNESTCVWEAPIPMPTDGKPYTWDENILNWVEVV